MILDNEINPVPPATVHACTTYQKEFNNKGIRNMCKISISKSGQCPSNTKIIWLNVLQLK